MRFAFLLLLSLWSYGVGAFEGRVIAAHDGDTITVINERGVIEKIRLYRSDSPEMPYTIMGKHVDYQPYAAEARDALAGLCLATNASITRRGVSYGRTVATVQCAGQDAATYQVENGHAWAYRYTATKRLKQLQAAAKAKGVGLWALPNPIEPYLWRKGVK